MCDDDEVNRAILWIKARLDKKGVVARDDLKETVAKIVSMMNAQLNEFFLFKVTFTALN